MGHFPLVRYTTGATNITKQNAGSRSAQLNAIHSCYAGSPRTPCTVFMRWRAVGARAWTDVPSVRVTRSERNALWQQTASGLVPKARYEYQVCGKEASFSHVLCAGRAGAANSTSTFTADPGSGDWPQYRYEPGHSAYNPLETTIDTSNVTGLTRVSNSDPCIGCDWSPPTIAGGLVWTSSSAGLYGFGCFRYCSYTSTASVGGDSAPAVSNGVVYVTGLVPPGLSAFSASCSSSCSLLWTGGASDPNDQNGSPTVAGGVVYVGGTNHKLSAFNASGCGSSTCPPLWTATTVEEVVGPPAVAGGFVYVSATNSPNPTYSKLYAFPASCSTPCSPSWTASIGGIINGSPTVAGGVVYVGSQYPDKKLYAFNASGCGASTCNPLWTATTGGGGASSPAVANGVVYVGSDKLYAFSASPSCSTPCAPLWTGSAGNPGVSGEPAVANGVVYVEGAPSQPSSGNGDLVAFAASGCGRSTCGPLWQTLTGHEAPSSPAVSNGVLFVTGSPSFADPYAGLVAFAPLAALVGGPVTPAEMYGGGGFCLSCLMKSLTHSSVGSPIDAEDGNMYHTFPDIQIPGRGYPLAFTRTYNSNAAGTSGPLGYGWVDNLGAKLAVSGSTATVTEENGAQTTFTLNGGVWTPPPRDIATLTQNSDGSWTLVRDSRQTLTFNGFGQLTSMSDLNGYITTYGYTGGQLTTVTDQAGRAIRLGYTGGHLTSVTDPSVTPNRIVTFQYNDGAGNLTDVIDVHGGHTQFGYDGAHRMTLMKDPNCYATSGCPGIITHYDGQGRADYQTDQLNRKTTLAYAGDPTTATGATTTITDPKGNVTVDTYEYGVKVAETRGSGSAQAATTVYSYNTNTVQPTAIIDPNGNQTTMTYDNHGNMLTRTDALGRQTVYTYDGFNEAVTVTDPKKVTTTNTYDSHGNLTSVSTPCPDCSPPGTRTVTYSYNDSAHPGDVSSMTDPDGKTWTYGYDAYGDRASTTDPLRNKSTSSYNADGWLLATVSARGHAPGANPAAFTTTYGHNAFGQVTTTTDPLGHGSVNGYDADQNLTSVKDADNNTTTYSYDLANEQTFVHRADGTTTQTKYWPDATMEDQIDGAGHDTHYVYDALARVSAVTDPLGRVTQYGYDPADNRTSITDPQNQVTTMSYDAANELTGISYSDGKTPNVSNITYDNDGQRTAMTDGTGTSSYSYDSLHRLTNSTDGPGNTVGYGYDLKGQLTSLTYPGGLTVTRGYDDAGRLTSVNDGLGHTTQFSYDPDSDVVFEIYPGGPVDFSAHDNGDRLTRIVDTRGGAAYASFDYTRDNNDQITSTKPNGVIEPTDSYSYTPLNQLKSANNQSYSYDSADNIRGLTSGATLSYDAANEPKSLTQGANSTTYTYDQRGNRTIANPATGNTTTLTYDEANRLTAYNNGTASGAYAYNGDGLRMSKTVLGNEPFVWDLSGSLPQMLKDGNRSYIYGPDALPVERLDATNTPIFYHHDQLGSTRILTDAAGATTATYSYDAYGNTTVHTGTADDPLRYAGQYADMESGLYYLRARYHDPSTAQFMSRDPAVADTRSPYAIVAGNPLNATDPAGLFDWNPIDWGKAAVGAAGNVGAWIWNHTGGPAVNYLQNNTVGFCITGALQDGIMIDGSITNQSGGQACLVANLHGVGVTTTTEHGPGLNTGLGCGFQTNQVANPRALQGPGQVVGGGYGLVGGDWTGGRGGGPPTGADSWVGVGIPKGPAAYQGLTNTTFDGFTW